MRLLYPALLGICSGLAFIWFFHQFYFQHARDAYAIGLPEDFQRLGSILVAWAVGAFAITRPIYAIIQSSPKSVWSSLDQPTKVFAYSILWLIPFLEVSALIVGTLQWGYGDAWLCIQKDLDCAPKPVGYPSLERLK